MPKSPIMTDPPVLPPLPDTTGWSADQLMDLAAERCQAAGDVLGRDPARPGKLLACRRHQLEALHGRDPFEGATLATLLDLLPDRAHASHRELLSLLFGRGQVSLESLAEATGRKETDCSARLRDLRGMGLKIKQGVDKDLGAVYWLEV